MKRRKIFGDPFITGGFVTSFFSGFLYPVYVTLILSKLDARVIALGSILSGGFPVVIGLALENRRLHDWLYALLPAIMVGEVALGFATVFVAQADIAAYYVVTMLILGVFTSAVMYLLQRVKEGRYRRGRAAFDRRYATADALGFLAGSGVSMVGVPKIGDPLVVAALFALQTAVVYSMLLAARRKTPARRALRAANRSRVSVERVAEDPFPWRQATLAAVAA
jgi:hypothetical protein